MVFECSIGWHPQNIMLVFPISGWVKEGSTDIT